jgi:hypothetical protein
MTRFDMSIISITRWKFKEVMLVASDRLDTNRHHPRYFDLLPNFNPGKIAQG